MDIKTIAVIGAGTMGRGIAQAAAAAGYDVRVADADAQALERGLTAVRDALQTLVDKGKIESTVRDRIFERIAPARTLAEGAAGADLVVEAAPEILDLKASIFRELDAVALPQAILASNTSSLPVGKLAAATKRPERVVGMHF